jgi:hypothetical protein
MLFVPVVSGGAGWNGVPWDPKNDGLALAEKNFGYANNRAFHTFVNGGVIVLLEGESADAGQSGILQATFPNAGLINLGGKDKHAIYNFAMNIGQVWFPAGTSFLMTQYSQNVVERYIDADFETCAKAIPGLINLGDFDEATNLKSFSIPTAGGYAITSANNPNGCTLLWFGSDAKINDLTPGGTATRSHNFIMEVRDSGGSVVTNGAIAQVPSGNYSSNGAVISSFRFPLPLKLDADEQLYMLVGHGGYVLAHDPDGWV